LTPATDRPAVAIPGTVRYLEAAMGFAVAFDTLTPDQIAGLTHLLGEPPKDLSAE